MGSDIGTVYSVPFDELRALPGSSKTKLASMIARGFFNREEIDAMFEEYDPPNSLNSAVQQILNGEPLLEDRGALYGYAVEALCWATGTTFFLPIGFPTVEYLDQFLERRSSLVTLADLMFSGFLLRIPEPSDFPMAGYWKPEQVIVASEFFGGLQVQHEDQEIQMSVKEIRRWLEEAIKHQTDALVGFYY